MDSYNTFDLQQLKEQRQHRKAAAIGLVVGVLALIGLITLVTFAVQTVQSMIGHEREKAAFEELITPLVMFDPVPFQTISEAGDTTVLQSAVWRILLGSKKVTFAFDENGQLIIPASDIEISAKQLFGADVTVNHQTFGAAEMTFTYDETSKTYRVPPVGYLGTYSPKVIDYRIVDGFTVLTVGYMSPGYLWSYDNQGVETDPQPTKVFYYVLLQNSDGYYIIAVQQNDPVVTEA